MVTQWTLAAAAKKITSPFCCGGSVTPDSPVTICYKQRFSDGNDSWKSIELPDCIESLEAACSAASFANGGKKVMDESFRKALKMEPGDFTTSFDLSEYGILDDIKTLLFPTKKRVIAKLYKLNVYAQGDFFKPNVDTPGSGNMLASLVVSLPCAYSGGDLVVRNGRKSHSFGFEGDNNYGRISWAAFFSDCEHEVLEVTSGHRLTLTYNLFAEECTIPKTDFSSMELYKLFVEAKESGKKMTLGFPCKHFYAQNRSVNVPEALKGSDAFVYHAAVAAGLKAEVCAVWKSGNRRFIGKLGEFIVSQYCYYELDDESESDNEGELDDEWESDAESEDEWGADDERESDDEGEFAIEDKGIDVSWFLDRSLIEDRNIMWCGKKFEWNLGGACASYGNEADTLGFVCAVAILVREKKIS